MKKIKTMNLENRYSLAIVEQEIPLHAPWYAVEDNGGPYLMTCTSWETNHALPKWLVIA